VRQFVLRFSDIGVGIDDAPILAAVNDTTGTIGLPFTLQQDGVDLVRGVDYLFVWNSNTDEAIFRAVTEFPLEHFYTILVDNDPAFGPRSDLPAGVADPHPNDGVTGVRDLAGNFLAINQPDGSTQYRILLTDGVNDPPIHSLPAGRQQILEDQTLIFSAANGNGISVSDADVHLAAEPALNMRLEATDGVLTLSQTTGLTFSGGTTGTAETMIEFRGSVADINAALDGLIYQPTAEFFNTLSATSPAVASHKTSLECCPRAWQSTSIAPPGHSRACFACWPRQAVWGPTRSKTPGIWALASVSSLPRTRWLRSVPPWSRRVIACGQWAQSAPGPTIQTLSLTAKGWTAEQSR
jgi:hypothetical protein